MAGYLAAGRTGREGGEAGSGGEGPRRPLSSSLPPACRLPSWLPPGPPSTIHPTTPGGDRDPPAPPLEGRAKTLPGASGPGGSLACAWQRQADQPK